VMSEADIVPNRAEGYVLVGGKLKHQEWVSPSLNTTADGSLHLSVLDLAKWDQGLYAEKLLKRATLEEMWTAGKTLDGKPFRYGLGWGVGEVNGCKLVYHNGNWQGFVTHIARYLDEQLTVVILTNLGDENEKLNTAAQTIAGFYVPSLAPRE
jgi:CubicO group peptidase (beta-lactamase class C family)